MKSINHIAVIVAVILHQALGFFWYGVLFLDPWLKGLGRDYISVNPTSPIPIAIDVITWLLAAYVIAWLLGRTGTTTAVGGMKLGALLWLGISLATLVPHYQFVGVNPVVTAIDSANTLVSLLLMSGLLGTWPRRLLV
jgi:hypothetical protein